MQSVLGKNYTAIIASYNRDYMKVLKSYITKMGVFSTCDLAFDGGEALELIQKRKPDLLFLDIILPLVDGFGVLEALAEENILQSTGVIVFSGVSREFIVDKAFEYGADFFLIKPVKYETFERRVLDVLGYKKGLKKPDFPPRIKSENIISRITPIIQRLGLPASTKGYNYVRYAIKLVLENPKNLDAVTTMLYPAVAERFDSTPSRVERDIRHAIETAWSKGDVG